MKALPVVTLAAIFTGFGFVSEVKATPPKFLTVRSGAMRITSRNAKALVEIALDHQRKGDFITALLIFEEILKHNPTDHKTLKQMVLCYEAMINKELKQAIAQVPQGQPAIGPQFPNLPEVAPILDRDLPRADAG